MQRPEPATSDGIVGPRLRSPRWTVAVCGLLLALLLVEVIARIGPTLGLLARGELRDALVSLTTERIYVTKSWRAVLGIHLTISPQVVLKLEGVYNGEYGPVPSIPNSLVTSSLVLMY